jgi:hypothetical protein
MATSRGINRPKRRNNRQNRQDSRIQGKSACRLLEDNLRIPKNHSKIPE